MNMESSDAVSRPTIGIPKEIFPREQRVAATPASIARLRKAGFDVLVEKGAGLFASIDDETFQEAGAVIVESARELYARSSWVIKVRPPVENEEEHAHEADLLREGATLICFLWPAQNKELVEKLRARKINAMAMDCVPRTTKAQKLDALSAMANIVGYRAVLEGAQAYGKLLAGQVTAAGKMKPANVLVIGAGVAGLAAIGAARSLGAVVRAFDTRKAVREQVESMGARFVEFNFNESGEGAGGYAKQMSDAYLKAEQELLAQHCRECDIVISTALIPGIRAPELITAGAVVAMQRGSVIVDLAAEQGGNCALTKLDEMVEPHGVKILGFTDLASRMARQTSELYANTIMNLIDEVSKDGKLTLDLDDEIHRGVIVTKDSEILWPPPKREVPTPAQPMSAKPPPPQKKSDEKKGHADAGVSKTASNALLLFVATLFVVAAYNGQSALLQHLAIFVLACLVGWRLVWNVTAALHTPLMSVTNAISGIILVGGMVLMRGADITIASVLGAIAVFVAVINIAGGFLVTQRMLQMFRK